MEVKQDNCAACGALLRVYSTRVSGEYRFQYRRCSRCGRSPDVGRVRCVLNTPNSRRNRPVVYKTCMVQCGGSEGPVRIYATRNVPKTLETLQAGNVYPVVLLVELQGDHLTALCSLFAHSHIEGCWFSMSDSMREFVNENSRVCATQ
jgi:hypothetical protein